MTVEIDGIMVEDASWQGKNNYKLINLDAKINGVNMALKWRLKDVGIKTDLAIVLSGIVSVIIKKILTKSTMTITI